MFKRSKVRQVINTYVSENPDPPKAWYGEPRKVSEGKECVCNG